MDLPDVIKGEYMDAAIKKRLPGFFLLSFSTYVVCVPAAFTQIISFDLMLDLNSFPGNGYAWTFPAFVAGECASMGLCASTLDRYGRKIPYLIGSLLFIASSAACALSTEMMPFILFRGVEGFGAGIIIVTCIAQIFFDVEDPKLRYMANGIMSLGFGGGMLTGIFAGRAVMGVIDWPVAFWIFAILQALVMYPSLEILSNGRKSTLKVNPLAAIIITVWAGLFVFFLQKMYLDWSIADPMAQMCLGLLVMLFLAFLLIEVRDPESMFHRKVKNAKLTAVSLVFIVLLGVIDMGAVGFMVKIAFFTYQMSVMEAAPFFIILVCGAMRPMNPMTPVNAKHTADIRVHSTSVLFLSFSTSTPRELATSSPADSALRSIECLKRRMEHIRTTGKMITSAPQDALAMLPMIHSVISLSCSSLEKYLLDMIPAWNR